MGNSSVSRGETREAHQKSAMGGEEPPWYTGVMSKVRANGLHEGLQPQELHELVLDLGDPGRFHARFLAHQLTAQRAELQREVSEIGASLEVEGSEELDLALSRREALLEAAMQGHGQLSISLGIAQLPVGGEPGAMHQWVAKTSPAKAPFGFVHTLIDINGLVVEWTR